MEAMKGEIKMENELMNNVPTVDPVVEPVVEPAVTEEPVVELEVTEDPIENKIVEAVVSGAKKLNVRKEPVKDAEVVCVVTEGTNVTVYPTESTDEFYKVFIECKNSFVEGYCVKSFITLK